MLEYRRNMVENLDINFNEKMLKVEILVNIEMKQFFKSHSVLRLQPYHSELIPIEMVHLGYRWRLV